MGLYGRGATAEGSARRDDDIAWVVSRREIKWGALPEGLQVALKKNT